ncbi:hypothetical protein BDW42DRAFT_176813 [Aspergillus taichungensis]|uniref:PXA domain-containing protein n=1 Tax=Aspergillus taichungensis TaxID=482145 RepID=A0A2J5HK40_9EURO|nr:hypothetical protein BDW42DRAFT_176813 [Aspergillus taichungensis]
MVTPNDVSSSHQSGSQKTTGTQITQSADHEDVQLNPSSPLVQPKDAVDYILNLLATSSTEGLLGIFSLLIGVTYIVLGRLGLLLIGIATGVVLHATWEGDANHAASGPLDARNPVRRREVALDIANRLLDWPARKAGEVDRNNDDRQGQDVVQEASEIQLDYSSFRPETAAALRSLTDAVIRDYVNYWYKPILPTESTFPMSCRQLFASFVYAVSSHLSRKRTSDAFLEFLTNSSSMIIVFLNELSTALENSGSSAPEQTILHYIEIHPESSLANLLSGQQQHKKLNLVADDILSNFLDQKAYSCPTIRNFLREVLSGIIFETTISSLSRPEFINGWIIYLFSEGESEIMSAIDAGVEGAKNQGVDAKKQPDDMKQPIPASSELSGMNPSRFSTSSQSMRDSMDAATEQALAETKRLSAMMAAQNLQRQSSEQAHSDESQQVSSESDREDSDFSSQKSRGKYNMSAEEGMDTTQDAQETEPFPMTSSTPPPSSIAHPFHTTPRKVSASRPLTLHRASISVDDGSGLEETALIRSKPAFDYLLQIEAVSSNCAGWMVFRKYADFESLHETLETISRLNRLQNFKDNHPILPSWKGQTKYALSRNLERYLQDALEYEALAECEKMKRFLEKDGPIIPQSAGSSAKSGFSFPAQAAIENMGKGVLGVFTNAPKSVSGGSKAVFGGVSGVFGVGTGRNPSFSSTAANGQQVSDGVQTADGSSASREGPQERSIDNSQLASDKSAISDHPAPQLDQKNSNCQANHFTTPLSGESENPENQQPQQPSHSLESTKDETSNLNKSGTEKHSISQDETRIAVELIFAVINELYMLSSAWNIRRTLLNAAKSYILRPGNPSLETIRILMQESMIDANTSDDALGSYLTRLRENSLPTEDELKNWPPPPSDAEKERLREKARSLFVQRGLPQALTSVMGAAASREALEKVFDCLQVDVVARGFVFAVFLQALRAVTF